MVLIVEVDNDGILAQIQRTREAGYKLESEMNKLEEILRSAKAKEKRDSEESPQG